jgi:NADP-dependent 3-hydroxy acid dehydrogenase YdfG
VVVTGATGGIGSAIVEEFADRGDRVLAMARPSAALDALCERLDVEPAPVDLMHPDELPAAVLELDRVDALIHAAGIADVASVEDSPHDLWQRHLTINLTGPAELTRALLPALRAARGRVVFINAVGGLTAVPNWSAYAASKAALSELADSLRLEEGPHGVRVTSIYPGGVATELLRRVRAGFGREFDPARCVSPATLATVISSVLDAPTDVDITEIALQPPPPPA